MIGTKVAAQRKDPVAQDDNPLGRVLKVYEENKDVDVETLELKLGEAILTETPALTKYINIGSSDLGCGTAHRSVSTVIGMIETFQAITLFGTGDPKTMASGISKALMTTVLGLCVAIPTTLLHAVVSARSRGLVHIIEEQSAGIIADHAEKSGKTLGLSQKPESKETAARCLTTLTWRSSDSWKWEAMYFGSSLPLPS